MTLEEAREVLRPPSPRNLAQRKSRVQIKRRQQGHEVYMLCRSEGREAKDRAIREKQERSLLQDLEALRARIEAGLTTLGRRVAAQRRPDRAKIDRQIGRLLGRNVRAAGLFDIRVTEGAEGQGLPVAWTERTERQAWAALSEGHYLLRTNLQRWAPAELWKTYIQLTQADAAFRVQKSELALRPIWHHLEQRVQAHILFSFLAYALWKILEQWMAWAWLGNAPRTLLAELAWIKVVDVLLPTSTGRTLRLQCLTQPDASQRTLLACLRLSFPSRPSHSWWADAVPEM